MKGAGNDWKRCGERWVTKRHEERLGAPCGALRTTRYEERGERVNPINIISEPNHVRLRLWQNRFML